MLTQKMKARRISAKMKTQWAKQLEEGGHLECPFQGCSQMYVTLANFLTHYKWCSGEKDFKICPYCSSVIFSGNKAVLHHMEVEHPDKVEEYKNLYPLTNDTFETYEGTSEEFVSTEGEKAEVYVEEISSKKIVKKPRFSAKENHLSKRKFFKHKINQIKEAEAENISEFKKHVRFDSIVSKINSVSEDPMATQLFQDATEIKFPKKQRRHRLALTTNVVEKAEYFEDEPSIETDDNPTLDTKTKVTTKSKLVLDRECYKRYKEYLNRSRDWGSERKTYSRQKHLDISLITTSSAPIQTDLAPLQTDLAEIQDIHQLNDNLESSCVSLSTELDPVPVETPLIISDSDMPNSNQFEVDNSSRGMLQDTFVDKLKGDMHSVSSDNFLENDTPSKTFLFQQGVKDKIPCYKDVNAASTMLIKSDYTPRKVRACPIITYGKQIPIEKLPVKSEPKIDFDSLVKTSVNKSEIIKKSNRNINQGSSPKRKENIAISDHKKCVQIQSGPSVNEPSRVNASIQSISLGNNEIGPLQKRKRGRPRKSEQKEDLMPENEEKNVLGKSKITCISKSEKMVSKYRKIRQLKKSMKSKFKKVISNGNSYLKGLNRFITDAYSRKIKKKKVLRKRQCFTLGRDKISDERKEASVIKQNISVAGTETNSLITITSTPKSDHNYSSLNFEVKDTHEGHEAEYCSSSVDRIGKANLICLAETAAAFKMAEEKNWGDSSLSATEIISEANGSTETSHISIPSESPQINTILTSTPIFAPKYVHYVPVMGNESAELHPSTAHSSGFTHITKNSEISPNCSFLMEKTLNMSGDNAAIIVKPPMLHQNSSLKPFKRPRGRPKKYTSNEKSIIENSNEFSSSDLSVESSHPEFSNDNAKKINKSRGRRRKSVPADNETFNNSNETTCVNVTSDVLKTNESMLIETSTYSSESSKSKDSSQRHTQNALDTSKSVNENINKCSDESKIVKSTLNARINSVSSEFPRENSKSDQITESLPTENIMNMKEVFNSSNVASNISNYDKCKLNESQYNDSSMLLASVSSPKEKLNIENTCKNLDEVHHNTLEIENSNLNDSSRLYSEWSDKIPKFKGNECQVKKTQDSPGLESFDNPKEKLNVKNLNEISHIDMSSDMEKSQVCVISDSRLSCEKSKPNQIPKSRGRPRKKLPNINKNFKNKSIHSNPSMLFKSKEISDSHKLGISNISNVASDPLSYDECKLMGSQNNDSSIVLENVNNLKEKLKVENTSENLDNNSHPDMNSNAREIEKSNLNANIIGELPKLSTEKNKLNKIPKSRGRPRKKIFNVKGTSDNSNKTNIINITSNLLKVSDCVLAVNHNQSVKSNESASETVSDAQSAMSNADKKSEEIKKNCNTDEIAKVKGKQTEEMENKTPENFNEVLEFNNYELKKSQTSECPEVPGTKPEQIMENIDDNSKKVNKTVVTEEIAVENSKLYSSTNNNSSRSCIENNEPNQLINYESRQIKVCGSRSEEMDKDKPKKRGRGRPRKLAPNANHKNSSELICTNEVSSGFKLNALEVNENKNVCNKLTGSRGKPKKCTENKMDKSVNYNEKIHINEKSNDYGIKKAKLEMVKSKDSCNIPKRRGRPKKQEVHVTETFSNSTSIRKSLRVKRRRPSKYEAFVEGSCSVSEKVKKCISFTESSTPRRGRPRKYPIQNFDLKPENVESLTGASIQDYRTENIDVNLQIIKDNEHILNREISLLPSGNVSYSHSDKYVLPPKKRRRMSDSSNYEGNDSINVTMAQSMGAEEITKPMSDPFDVNEKCNRQTSNDLRELTKASRDIINPSEFFFSDYIPKKCMFKILVESECEEYLPPLKSSMFIKNMKLPYMSETNWMAVKQFKCLPFRDSNNFSFFTGGPVSSSAFCPVLENEIQYIALSTNETLLDNQSYDSTTSKKGLIQIWNLGNLQSSKFQYQPFMEMSIAHNHGTVYEMTWCPKGAWQDPGKACIDLPRLGLLAVAFSDSFIRIYSIPHPKFIERNEAMLPLYFTSPSVTLEPLYGGPCSATQNSSCTCVSWQKTDACERIAGGYGNGLICVWLVNSPPTIFTKQDTEKLITPYLVFQAHGSPVTSISFSPLKGNRWLVSSSYDRTTKFFDLLDTNLPFCTVRKGFGKTVHWANNYCGAVASLQDNIIYKGSSFFKECGTEECSIPNIANPLSPLCASALSGVMNAYAIADVTGTVCVSFLKCLYQESKHPCYNVYPIFKTDLVAIDKTITNDPILENHSDEEVFSVVSNMIKEIEAANDGKIPCDCTSELQDCDLLHCHGSKMMNENAPSDDSFLTKISDGEVTNEEIPIVEPMPHIFVESSLNSSCDNNDQVLNMKTSTVDSDESYLNHEDQIPESVNNNDKCNRFTEVSSNCDNDLSNCDSLKRVPNIHLLPNRDSSESTLSQDTHICDVEIVDSIKNQHVPLQTTDEDILYNLTKSDSIKIVSSGHKTVPSPTKESNQSQNICNLSNHIPNNDNKQYIEALSDKNNSNNLLRSYHMNLIPNAETTIACNVTAKSSHSQNSNILNEQLPNSVNNQCTDIFYGKDISHNLNRGSTNAAPDPALCYHVSKFKKYFNSGKINNSSDNTSFCDSTTGHSAEQVNVEIVQEKMDCSEVLNDAEDVVSDLSSVQKIENQDREVVDDESTTSEVLQYEYDVASNDPNEFHESDFSDDSMLSECSLPSNASDESSLPPSPLPGNAVHHEETLSSEPSAAFSEMLNDSCNISFVEESCADISCKLPVLENPNSCTSLSTHVLENSSKKIEEINSPKEKNNDESLSSVSAENSVIETLTCDNINYSVDEIQKCNTPDITQPQSIDISKTKYDHLCTKNNEDLKTMSNSLECTDRSSGKSDNSLVSNDVPCTVLISDSSEIVHNITPQNLNVSPNSSESINSNTQIENTQTFVSFYKQDTKRAYLESLKYAKGVNLYNISKDKKQTQTNSPEKPTRIRKTDDDLHSYESFIGKYGLIYKDTDLSIPPDQRRKRIEVETSNLHPDSYNLTSINTVAWNPNYGSHFWIFSGGNAGIGRLSCVSEICAQENAFDM